MMPSQRRSPECCVFKVGVVQDNSEKVIHHGDLEVTPTELIYTSEELNKQVTWPLKYLRRYAQEGQSLFVIEAGSRCPSGAGMYTFSTSQAAQLHSVVSRNMTGLVRSPQHSSSSLIITPGNPTSNSSSPTTSPTITRSLSVPGSVFEVKNIGDDQTLVKEGLLEITTHDIIYTDAVSHQRYQWPLMYLRRYGCEGNVFSIEAGRRCQGGEATYAFKTPQACEIRDLIQTIHQSDLDSPHHPPISSPPLLALSSPATQVLSHSSSTSNTIDVSSKDASSPPPHEFHRSDSLLRRSHSAMELSRNIFEVRNISDERKEVGQGKLEVTRTDLIYVDSNTHEKWKWPLRFLRRYGCNGNIFSFEAGRRCPGGEGLYAFSTTRASEIHEAIVLSINNRQSPEDSLGSMLDLSMQRLSPPLSARSYSYSPWRHSQQLVSQRPLPAVPHQLHPRAHSVSPSSSPLPPSQTPPSKPPRTRRRAGNNKQHTYDIPSEVKNEYIASQQLEEDANKDQVKENKSPKKSKKEILSNKPPPKSSKPPPPKKGKAAIAWLKNKQSNSSTEAQSPTKKTHNRKEKSKSPCSPTSPEAAEYKLTSSSEELKIYENTKQLVNAPLGDTPDSPQFESLVPQPMESNHPQGSNQESITSSLYQNLECFSPAQSMTATTEMMYANLEVTGSAPPQVNNEDSFVPGSYIEVEFMDGDSVTNHAHQDTPLNATHPAPSSKNEEDSVTYATPDFERTAILSKLQHQQRDVANHETLLKRHELREGKHSRRKK